MSTTGTTRVDIPGRSTYECGCGFGTIDDSDDVDGFYGEVYEHERWHELEDERAAADVALPTFNEAVRAEAARKAEAAMDEMWASRERRPHFAPVERGESGWRRPVALAVAALLIVLACLVWGASTARAGGSDSPTPYSVTVEGVTLPAGRTFVDGGHVNVRTNAGSFGLHFEDRNWPAEHPKRAYIGKSFIPWSAFGIPGDACIEWVQVHGFNEHFGEGGQHPVCLSPATEEPTEPEPTVPPTEEPTTPDPGPQPPNEVEVQYRDTVDCDAAEVVVEEFHRHAGYYLGKDGQWHLGGFGAWFLADTFTRDLNPAELEACTPETEPEPTPEPTPEPEPTDPPVTEPPTEEPTAQPTPDPEPTPEPTAPVTPEPTLPTPTVDPEPTTPAESTPTEPGTDDPSTPQARTIVTPDVPVVDESAEREVLAETGADTAAGFILAGLTLVLLGAVMVAVHRIRGRR